LRIYHLGLWLTIFFAIFLRLPPNKFLRIPPDLSPVPIRLALLFLLLRTFVSTTTCDEITTWFPLAHHFLTIGVERVVNDPLSGILRVIVFVAEMAEAFGDGFSK
jgi:hypothetical protein